MCVESELDIPSSDEDIHYNRPSHGPEYTRCTDVHVTKYRTTSLEGTRRCSRRLPGPCAARCPNLSLVRCAVRSAVPPVARVILWPAPSRRRGSRTHTPDRRNGPKSSLLYATRVHATRSSRPGSGDARRPACSCTAQPAIVSGDNRINLKQHDDIIMPGGDT